MGDVSGMACTTGGDMDRGAALMCAGGAVSPSTLPDTGGTLLSTVLVGFSRMPPWIEESRALLSPGSAEGAGAATTKGARGAGGAAGGAGGGGGAPPTGVLGDEEGPVEPGRPSPPKSD